MSHKPILVKPVDIVVFDMDGTLIKHDSLYIQIKKLAVIRFHQLVYAFIMYLFKNRVVFKRLVHDFLERADKQDSWLKNIKHNQSVMEELHTLQSQGYPIIIATGAYIKTAIKVLTHINIKPQTLIATENNENMTGRHKLKYLQPYIHNKTWAYYGDSQKSDPPIFHEADQAFLIQQDKIISLKD